LVCDLDIHALRRRSKTKQVVCKKGIIAVDGTVPAQMLCSYPFAAMATVPVEVADWINSLLQLRPDRHVRPKHPGLVRLSRWINSCFACEPEEKLMCSELLERAKRWLPEYFVGVDLSLRQLQEHRRVGLADYEVDDRTFEPDPREAEAVDCLGDPLAARRIRGLSLLAEIHDPDLFDWCAMLVDDEAMAVQLAALRTMLRCQDGDPEIVEPLAASTQRHVRAAAIAVLARHGGDSAWRWIERGLKDPQACVRVEAVRFLGKLTPARHRPIFELAVNDPNPDVAGRALRFMSAKRSRKPVR